jgi:hypothetical protein
MMSIITCQECSKQISDQAEACPHCGYKTQPVATNPSNIKAPNAKAHGSLGGKLVMAMLLVFATVIYLAGQGVGNNASTYKENPQDAEAAVKEHLDYLAAQCTKGYSAACEEEKLVSDLITNTGKQAY